MLRVSRFTGLALTTICILAAFAMLLSFTPVTGFSPSARSLTNQTKLEQSPSDPPVPGEQPAASRVFLPQVYKVNPDGEHPLADSQMTIAGDYTDRVSPPIANRHTFISGMGGELDQYLNRTGTIDGRLTFTIAISAPVLPPDVVLLDSGFVNPFYLPKLTEDHVLPKQAMLVLRIYDVDDDEGLSCPETDYILINGNRITSWETLNGASLRGGNERWNTWSVPFSPSMLRFPTALNTESDQPPAPAINEIAIDVDAECQATWAVEVDWGAIVLGPNVRNPIVLVHGWTGNKTTLDKFFDFGKLAGYNMYKAVNLEEGVRPWDKSAELLTTTVISAVNYYQTDKVNIFAHSRGGLFTRRMLRSNVGDIASHVDTVVTFATPHHGTDWIIPFSRLKCPWISDAFKSDCWVAAEDMTVDAMRGFNYADCRDTRQLLVPAFTTDGVYASALDQHVLPESLVNEFACYSHPVAPGAEP